jgi:hypothetical protein
MIWLSAGKKIATERAVIKICMLLQSRRPSNNTASLEIGSRVAG